MKTITLALLLLASRASAYTIQGNLVVTGSDTASAFFGNGANLTGIPASGTVTGMQATIATLGSSTDTIAGKVSALQTLTGALGVSSNTAASNISALQTLTGALGVSSNTAANNITALQSLTGTLGVSTNSIAGNVSSLQTLTATLGSSTNTIAGNVSALQTLTATMGVSTATLNTGKAGLALSNTFTSSQTIQDGTGGGLLVKGDSVTASAFFGDGSHITGIPGVVTGGINGTIPGWTGSNTQGTTIITYTASSATVNGNLGVTGSITSPTHIGTMSVTGNAFSVGGSTFVVSGGQAQVGGLNVVVSSKTCTSSISEMSITQNVFTGIAGSTLTLTLPFAGDVVLEMSSEFYNANDADNNYFTFGIDGVTVNGGNALSAFAIQTGMSNSGYPANLRWEAQNLSAGTHNFYLAAKVSGGTMHWPYGSAGFGHQFCAKRD